MTEKTAKLADPESAKGRLLTAAARLFRTKGYERTTVRDIAQEVGILSGSIFHHFRNKDDILRAVMSECVERLLVQMEHALKGISNPQDRLRAMIRCELNAILGQQGNALTVLVFEWRALSDESQKALLEKRHAYERLWQNELKNAQNDLRADVDPLVLRRFLHGALYWTTHWYQEGGDFNLDDLTEQAMRLITD
ncbi:TetR/AcrR family transcriptional regulator [Sansalvadorimonas sp. 2012CJ34-2]|uniref:TetR/AcrR family transcriptional regulator n=1 Tax=Parendozoicomonas callyspongiae TaxID=2942213 RepID=A0ABT0PJ27_9GAMM|nr:TetR/AcrR family transcriptional regulator [Sansalvadorimonas sp. 2012CJ34-2]MCL6271389.1 TetR/AcrR family transcriptional regulator [Sansalvadorimonas sp. 2012CJ34-2]